jgi:hypothetical protein
MAALNAGSTVGWSGGGSWAPMMGQMSGVLGQARWPVLSAGLEQLAKQLAEVQSGSGDGDSSSCSSGSSSSSSSAASSSAAARPALLQQLAQAASRVQKQLEQHCNTATTSVFAYQQSPDAEAPDTSSTVDQSDMQRKQACFARVLERSPGLFRTVDSGPGGSRAFVPDTRQHALLSVLDLLQCMEQLVVAVCATVPPPSLACANPACDNVSGLSDMHLVWRRGVCGHCRAARFCSTACLRAHWAAHRDPGSLVEAVLGGGGGV